MYLSNTTLFDARDMYRIYYAENNYNIVRVIKSRRMRWAGHVARMVEERGMYRVLLGKPEGRNHRVDLGVDGWIILGWISMKWDMGIWTGLGWPKIEIGGGRL